MPRVRRQKKSSRGGARVCGACNKTIAVGEEYYTWSFRYGGRRVRCLEHPPKPSDLTQSKLSTVYAAQETAQEELAKASTFEDITAAVQIVAEAAREVADEYHTAAEPFGNAGENQERGDEMEGFADELESWEPSNIIEEEDDCGDCEGTGEVTEDCNDCDGTGHINDDESQTCESCEGQGTVTTQCETCEGGGKLAADQEELDAALDEARNEAQEAIDACPL